MIDRKHNFALTDIEQFTGNIEFIIFHAGIADADALGLQKCVAHCPTDEHLIDPS